MGMRNKHTTIQINGWAVLYFERIMGEEQILYNYNMRSDENFPIRDRHQRQTITEEKLSIK